MISYEKVSEDSFHGFLWIFITQFVSLIGSQIVSFAVIWYLTVETGSSLILSIASVASILPMIIVSPFAGVIADRANKNMLLILTDAIQAGATLILILLFRSGLDNLWYIITLLAVRGTCQGFQNPVSISVIPLMVPEKKIKSINSVNQIFHSLLNIASPAIGVYAISQFQIQDIYWLDVFTFIPTAICLLMIRIPSVTKKIEKGTPSFKKDFGEGFRYIKTSGLTSVFLMFATANFIVVPIFSLFPLLILNYHSGSAVNYSVVEILFQVGLIFGAISLMVSKKKSSMKSVIIFGMLLSVVLLLLALVPVGTWWLFYIMCAILGIDLAYIDTQLVSVLQINIPKELQGRVFGAMFTIIKSINPLGLIIWGLIGEVLPILWIFILSPTISIIVYVLLLKFTNMIHYGDKYDSMEELDTELNKFDLKSSTTTQNIPVED